MPKLIRLYIISVAIGFAIAAAFVGALYWFDLAGVGKLIRSSSMGWVAVIMLITFFGVMFSGVQFAIRIMMMAEDDDDEPKGGLRQHAVLRRDPVPLRVGAQARPRPMRRRSDD